MPRGISFRVAAVCASLALAACGGGGGGSVVPSTVTPGKGGNAQAALSFFIPKAGTPSVKRRPAYLPSTTASIVVTVLNSDGTKPSPALAPTVANVGPSASGCQSASGGLQCTVAVSAPMGSLLFLVSAYGQPNGAGDVLATGDTAATIGSGPNSVNVSMTAGTNYAGVSLNGNVQTISVDHQHNTFDAEGVGSTFSTTGTFTTLPNGDLKLVIGTSTDSSTVAGQIAYAREMPDGALMFAATDSATPLLNGSSSPSADLGVATALAPCLTSGTFGYIGVAIGGPAFDATTTAYTTGTATLSPTGLTFAGTKYLFNGTSNGSENGSTQVCSNGIYSAQGQGSAIPGLQGFIVTSNGESFSSTSTDTGQLGFIPPSQPLDLTQLASQTYEAFQGAQGVTNNMTERFESPGVLQPAGGLTMKACQYVNFEANSVDTANCGTVTLTGQPLPGLITGTETNSTGTTSFIAVAGQINGKYMFIVLPESSGGGVTVVAMQH